MFKIVLQHSQYSKKQKILFFVFIMMSILNFGNYSFLTYNINGTPTSNPILIFVREARILLPIITISFLFANNYWQKNILKVFKKNSMIFLLCFIFLFNSFLSTEIVNSIIYSIWLFFSLLLIGLVVNQVNNFIDLAKLIKFGSAITVTLVLLSFAQLLTQGNESTLYSSKNYYAYPLLIYFLCELILFGFEQKISYKWLRIVILLFVLIGLFLSGRRAPTLCALIALVVFIYHDKKLFFISLSVLILIFFTTIIGASFLGFRVDESLTYQRFYRIITNEDNEDSSYSEREFIWDKYLAGFNDSPLLGNGLNTNESTLSRHYSGDLEGLSYHNSYLQVLVEAGIVGFIFFTTYLIISLKNILKNRNRYLIFFLLFFPTILINWVENNILPGQVFFIFSFTVWLFFQNERSIKFEA
jgi:O-antigen ligase